MCEAIQIMKDRSKQEGRLEGKIEIAANMKKKGFSDAAIADILEVNLDIVRQWLIKGTDKK